MAVNGFLRILSKKREDESLATAIYPNRLLAKKKVERLFGLGEFGDDTTLFYTKNESQLFKGYVRIVYGDHGPYVEFSVDNLICEPIKKFNRPTPEHVYYEWQTLDDGSDVKIYWQLRDVKNLPNAPAGGYKGNRPEGYADYRPNMYYVSPYEMIIQKEI